VHLASRLARLSILVSALLFCPCPAHGFLDGLAKKIVSPFIQPVALGNLVNHDPEVGRHVYRQYSLVHPYSENDVDIPGWSYAGSTVIGEGDHKSNYLRITPDRQSKVGNLWCKTPWMPVTKEGDTTAPFEAFLRFKVHGQGTKLFGDGFALWLTKESNEFGDVFGAPDQFTGLGITFDTYSNVNQGHQQYVSVILGDGTQKYDHEQDGGDIKLAGCANSFRGQEMDARIVYDGSLLRMYLARLDEGWEECFIVRKVKIPKGYFFGLSAKTGDLADNHDVISFKVTDPAPMTADEREDISARIELDVEQGVEEQEHHDPQYENPEPQPTTKELPMWVTVTAVILVLIVAVVVYKLATKNQAKDVKWDI